MGANLQNYRDIGNKKPTMTQKNDRHIACYIDEASPVIVGRLLGSLEERG